MAPGLPTNLDLLSTLTQLKFTYHALASSPPRPPLFMNSKLDVLGYPRKFTFVTLQTTKQRLSRCMLSTLSLSLSVALTIVTMLQACSAVRHGKVKNHVSVKQCLILMNSELDRTLVDQLIFLTQDNSRKHVQGLRRHRNSETQTTRPRRARPTRVRHVPHHSQQRRSAPPNGASPNSVGSSARCACVLPAHSTYPSTPSKPKTSKRAARRRRRRSARARVLRRRGRYAGAARISAAYFWTVTRTRLLRRKCERGVHGGR